MVCKRHKVGFETLPSDRSDLLSRWTLLFLVPADDIERGRFVSERLNLRFDGVRCATVRTGDRGVPEALVRACIDEIRGRRRIGLLLVRHPLFGLRRGTGGQVSSKHIYKYELYISDRLLIGWVRPLRLCPIAVK